MTTPEIKRLYEVGWSRVQIALECSSSDESVDFETALDIVDETINEMMKGETICDSRKCS